MSEGVTHVVGAGLAGLAASVALVGSGCRVVLHEAAPQAGGRCRSYLDTELGCLVDNGNHLLLSGNRAALTYLDAIGASETLVRAEPEFAFADFATGERWALRLGGAIPVWMLDPRRRIPGTSAGAHLADAVRLALAGREATVAATLDTTSPLYRRLWEPLTVAALNTAPQEGSARLLWRVVRDSLGRGAAAATPLLPRLGLSPSLVEPALAHIARHGGRLRQGSRLREIRFAAGRVASLSFDAGEERLGPKDDLVLALPPAAATRLVPDLTAPRATRAIVNAHFRCEPPAGAPPFLGVIGGTAEWIFLKPGHISVTVSAADSLLDEPADRLAIRLWDDVARALDRPPHAVPVHRIVREKRATFAATPEEDRRRPKTTTAWANLHLAGDWIDTGLPATMEGAIRSGYLAAARILANRRGKPLPRLAGDFRFRRTLAPSGHNA